MDIEKICLGCVSSNIEILRQHPFQRLIMQELYGTIYNRYSEWIHPKLILIHLLLDSTHILKAHYARTVWYEYARYSA